MSSVKGTCRSLITQEVYLQGKSKKNPPILSVSLKLFLEVTEVVTVLFTLDSAGTANPKLCCGEAALIVINSRPGSLTPCHGGFFSLGWRGRSGRLIGSCHIKVSCSVLWSVYPSSTSLSLGAGMKTKLDVLCSAMKWPTPVMERERERKETVGVCSHNWRMQSREVYSWGLSWKWRNPGWIYNQCKYLNAFDHKWVSGRSAILKFIRQSGKRHEQPHHSCLWGLTGVTSDSSLVVLGVLNIKVILRGHNFLEIKCSSYLSEYSPERH